MLYSACLGRIWHRHSPHLWGVWWPVPEGTGTWGGSAQQLLLGKLPEQYWWWHSSLKQSAGV